ncbi:MAG: ABC transporter substrate-binding protein [Clostridia bacterium]|nr:ABC transporter substrate-binding protein [Clostridia bacterium]
MRKNRLFALITALLLLSTGCTDNSISTTDAYTFTDDLDRTVTVVSHERTAVLLGSFADVWMLAGGTVCATADDAWDDFNLPLSENTVNLGGTKNLSLEGLLASEPDFIIASTNTQQNVSWKDTFDSAGIPAAYFDVSTFEDYLSMLKICTDITGREDLYQSYGLNLQETIDTTIAAAEQRIAEEGSQTVLFLRASAASIRAKNSHGTVLGEMLADLGCINIADNDENLLENLSLESILQANPDRIFIVQVGDDADAVKQHIQDMFEENPAWYELDAVKEGRIHYMDKRLYNLKPNAYWGEAYEKLEAILAE